MTTGQIKDTYVHTCIRTYIWAAVKINCFRRVQNIGYGVGGPIALQCFVQINTKSFPKCRGIGFTDSASERFMQDHEDYADGKGVASPVGVLF